MASTLPPAPPVPVTSPDMSPQQELEQWRQWRTAVTGGNPANGTPKFALTDEQSKYFNGPSPRPNDPRFANPLFSNAATNMFVNGNTHYDLASGSSEKNKGFWNNPETWMQFALAGGLVAAPLLAGAATTAGGGLTGGTSSGAALTGPGAGLTTAAEAADAAAAAPGLASTTIGTGMLGPIAGGAGADVSGTAASAGGGLLSRALGLTKGTSGSDLLSAAGQGLGQAATAAGNNRILAGEMALRNQAGNTSAQAAFENELLARAKEEQSQRNDALKQQYYANYVQNRRPGPFNPAGLTSYSPSLLSSATQLASQAQNKLANAPQYDTSEMAPLTSTTIDPTTFMNQYGKPGTLQNVSNWLSPTLTTLGRVARFF